MLYFEDLKIGLESLFDYEYHVTQEEIIEVGERWDPQPFHTDPIEAKKSIFGGLVASSAHIFSIWVRCGNSAMDRDKQIKAVTALGFNNLQWHEPVRPNDVLKSGLTVTDLRESKSKPDLGVVTLSNKVINQNNEIVFTLDNTFLVPKRNVGGQASLGAPIKHNK